MLVRSFLLNNEEIFEVRLKRSCEHYKIKQHLIILTNGFKSMICCFDGGKVNFENRNTILVCVNYLSLKQWIFNLFGVDKQMRAF